MSDISLADLQRAEQELVDWKQVFADDPAKVQERMDHVAALRSAYRRQEEAAGRRSGVVGGDAQRQDAPPPPPPTKQRGKWDTRFRRAYGLGD